MPSSWSFRCRLTTWEKLHLGDAHARLSGRVGLPCDWGNDMRNVQGGPLQRLVHTTICATTRSPGFDLLRYVPPGHHCGMRPSKWSAWAHTRENYALSGTSASNSTRSAPV